MYGERGRTRGRGLEYKHMIIRTIGIIFGERRVVCGFFCKFAV